MLQKFTNSSFGHKAYLRRVVLSLVVFLAFAIIAVPQSAVFAGKQCGAGDSKTTTSIDIGCVGKGNAITDATFAIIRFLTNGVGIVIVASLVVAGIQYTSSKGEPNETAKAIKRIQSNVVALLMFIFAYAMLNYIIPGGLLK